MIDLGDLGDRGIQFLGLDAGDQLSTGSSTAIGDSSIGAGDFNGDGIADLYFGAYGLQTAGATTGGGYVMLGSASGIDTDLSNAFLSFHGSVSAGSAGIGIASAGDVNGDGFDDLAVGDGDAAFVLFGRATAPGGEIDLTDFGDDGITISSATTNTAMGHSLLAIGDVNADGFDDFLVGAPNADPNGSNSGTVDLIFGSTAPADVDFDTPGAGGVSIVGGSAGLSAGSRLAAADVNGDGLTDLLVSTSDTDGRVGIVLGTDPVISSSVELLADADIVLNPDTSGKTAVAVGDFNGDGQDDVIAGVPNASAGGSGSGSVFGRAGPVTADLTFADTDEILRGDAAFQIFGIRIANLGDVNGDGIDDLIVGSGNNQAVVLFGRPDFFTPGNVDPITDVDAIDPSEGFVINGAAPYLLEGSVVDGPGDVNGDGLNDMLVGGFAPDGVAERVSLVYGAFTASSTAGSDSLTSGFQADSIAGGDGDDTIFGNGGDDTLVGEDGNDVLAGGDDDDSISGSAGDDNAWGQDGDDTLLGETGNDNLRGNPGNDSLIGDAGDDTLRGHPGDDTLSGDAGVDLLYGGAGDDDMDGGSGNDVLNGNSGNDTISGDDGADLLRGQGGADSLLGGNDNDTLRGMQGFDTLVGNDGDDLLSGGRADDLLSGGAGNDIFEFAQFQGSDRVDDFVVADDLLSVVGFSFADLTITDTADGARITIAAEGDSPTLAILLSGVQAADLDSSMFVGG